MKLDPRSFERLVKLLGMLGSDHDGELTPKQSNWLISIYTRVKKLAA
jgi:hypothetical protein